jgi:hypothetical protein
VRAPDGRHVPADGGPAEAGEQRRHQRDRDEGVREHEEQEGVGVGVAGGAVDVSGAQREPRRGHDLRRREERELPDQDAREGPARDAPGAAEAHPAEAEARAVAEADAVQRPQQHQRLHRDAEGGGAREERHHPGRPLRRAQPFAVGDHGHEDQDTRDRDDVVERRGPHERPEAALGVEHLPQHRVEAVEEHLR